MPVLLPRPLPLRTRDLPGTGGETKVVPEDFVVEEVPAYLPTGEGPHLYLWVEKRGLSTSEAAKLLADALGADARTAGYAGQKDRQAVTRQWMSFETRRDTLALDDPRLEVLQVARHRNRLRLGHARANRFRLVLRGTAPGAEARARAVLDALARDGLANFYGPQRFGRRGDNALLGAAVLGLATHPEAQKARREGFLRRLAVSALQSELFNRCLAERIDDGLFDRVVAGDVLRRRESGGLFFTTSPEVDQPRVDAGELDVTGPMPGWKERPAAQGEALAREERVLAQAGVPRDAFQKARGEAEGARRPYRVPVRDASVRAVDPTSLELAFELPSGAYATRVVAEITKSELALPADG
jgi:tRNA pseudouridine13 synthase